MFPSWKMLIKLSGFDAVLFICRECSCSYFPLGIVGIKEWRRASPYLLGLFFWSALFSKPPLRGQLGLHAQLICGSSGLSATISSLLPWCFWHVCFDTHKIKPKQYPNPSFAFCCQWNTSGSAAGLLKSLSTTSVLGNSFCWLNSDLSVWSGDGRNSQHFNDNLQKWSGMGKTSSRACPVQLSVSCRTVLEQTLLSITSYFARL